MRNFLVMAILVLLLGCQNNQPTLIEPQIIPEPESIQVDVDKQYILSNKVSLSSNNTVANESLNFLNDYLQSIGWNGSIDNDNAQIQYELAEGLSDEAYRLSVGEAGVQIMASHEKGFFYGTQTLIQLLPTEKTSASIPYLEIEDAPRFEWRGLHLDVGRHFFSTDFIKKYIDLMALYKFNTFHWHLTEDQGWRIEIKQYPKLTEIGSQRKETMVEKNFDPYKGDGKPYGGFYTQEEVKEIVAYAAERQVTIVPEIEMPGHSLAALAAYPELGCGPGPYEVGTVWGVYEDIYCPKEETFTFLENVLTEVMALFPSEYIHIGGDEAPKAAWKKSAVAQEVIRREGLKDEFELQSYFIKRIEKFLNSKGRKLIGWDEILEGGLAPGAAVMSWRGEAGGIESAEAGHKVVMSPNAEMYFDHYQANPESEPLAIGGFTTLKSVYHYEPIPEELAEDHHEYVMGAQANVWTEYMKTSDHVEYMVYPRALALSEVVWTKKENRDWEAFQEKLAHHYQILDNRNVNFHVAQPEGLSDGITLENKAEVALKTNYKNAKVYYTTDGSTPDEKANLYQNPFTVDLSNGEVTVKAIVIMEGGRKSSVAVGTYKKGEINTAIEPIKADPGLQTVITNGSFGSVNDLDGKGKSTVFKEITLPKSASSPFGMVFSGMVQVPADGIYTFYTTSDDGSSINIGGELIVDNDGYHGAQERSGQVALAQGFHLFELKYFDGGGGKSLEVEIEGPGLKRQRLTGKLLYH